MSALSERLEGLARSAELRNVIQVGGGEQATAALVSALAANPSGPRLFLIAPDQPGAAALRARHAGAAHVHVYQGPLTAEAGAVNLDDIAKFARTVDGTPGGSKLSDLLCDFEGARWREAGSDDGMTALKRIGREFGARHFDLVVLDGRSWSTADDLKHLRGGGAICLTGTSRFGGRSAWSSLLVDPDYELVFEDRDAEEGTAIFQRRAGAAELPVHFLTIVLNGDPWIRYHERVFEQLPFAWRWHVVEGVASLVHDTSWSVASGGRVVDQVHRGGRSIDGTTEYLDDLAARLPHNVSVYRKPFGQFWDGKREMVNAPIEHLREPCILWQVDSDELWTADQITTMRRMFAEDPNRTAAWFWCKYFVGADKAISTRYNYAQNPNQEWLRAWRFDPGMTWIKHEPPVLGRQVGDTDEWEDAGRIHPFKHDETEAQGLVFEHYAYLWTSPAARGVSAWSAVDATIYSAF